jgi:hypothetical protein
VEITSPKVEREESKPTASAAEEMAAIAYRKLNKKSELTPQELAAMMSSGSIGFDLGDIVS